MRADQRQKIDIFLQQLIFVLFNLLIFITPFIFTWFNQELFEFNKMIFVYALSILLGACYLGRMIVSGRLLWRSHKSDWLIAAFLVSQIISTLISMHPRTSWFGYYTRFNGGLLSTLTYISLFYTAKNNLKKEQRQLLINSLLLSSFFISLYAIPEHFGHSLSCLIVTQKFDVACWQQKVQERVFATFGQPNWLAAFLVMVIPINIWKIWQQPKKICFYLLLFANASALAFTKSRSGMLALSLGLGLLFLGKLVSSFKNKKSQWLALLLPLLLIGAVFLVSGPLQFSAEGETVISEDSGEIVPSIEQGGSRSSDIRRVVWRGALDVWRRYPLFGSGVETFAYSYYLDRPASHNLLSEWDFLYNKAHNELLNYLANSGLFGLLSYLALFFMLGWNLIWKWQQKKLRDQDLAVTASLLAMFVSNFFGFSTVVTNLLFVILAALLFAEINWPKIKKADQNWLNFLLLPLLALAAFLSWSNWQIWRADYLFTNGNNYLAKNDYQTGLTLIQKAIKISPQEALFYDEMASQYSQLAIAFAKDQDATKSSQFAQAAIQTSDYVFKLNPVHLNFYKSRAKIFLRLAQLNPDFYLQAKAVLEAALAKAPTDAKLYFNLSLIEEVLGNPDLAKKQAEAAIELKPNYGQARLQLAELLASEGNFEAAIAQYHYVLEKIDPRSSMALENLEVLEASAAAATSN